MRAMEPSASRGAGGAVQLGEIVEPDGVVGMLGAERSGDRQHALVERLGPRVGAGRLVQRRGLLSTRAVSGCRGQPAGIASTRW